MTQKERAALVAAFNRYMEAPIISNEELLLSGPWKKVSLEDYELLKPFAFGTYTLQVNATGYQTKETGNFGALCTTNEAGYLDAHETTQYMIYHSISNLMTCERLHMYMPSKYIYEEIKA